LAEADRRRNPAAAAGRSTAAGRGSWVGIDLGATNIAAGLIDEAQQVVERVKVPVPTGGPDTVLDALAEAVDGLGGDPLGVGVGVPGQVREGWVLAAPNLVGWDEPVDLAGPLARRVGLPVAVDNDATVGVLGEWRAGAGVGAAHLLGVWWGTGIGGGLVLDGRLYRGATGGAGEFGHVVVARDGAACGCGRHGCVEAYAGRANMERRAREAVAAGRRSALLDLQGTKPRMTSGVWAKALDKGDDLAIEILDEAVAALGAAVGSAVNLLDLDHVVIGGGLAEKFGQPLVDRVAAAARRHYLVEGLTRQVVVATLGDDAGVVGAAALARGDTEG
jgi:glucokinase